MPAEVTRKRHKLSPPDGGWGHVIMLATTVIMIATIVPLGVFGAIFGNFLAQLGDDTSGITLVTSAYNTISFFLGIVTSVLLKKYSYRKVALMGAIFHFIGALATVFTTSLGGLIFTYGILEGIGFGLLLPALYSAFNAYFDKKMAFMMSLSQTLMVVGYMVVPYIVNWTMAFYGYRGTLLLLAGLGAFCFPASASLQPVKWHLKKEIIESESSITVEPLISGGQSAVYRRRKSSVILGERVPSLANIGPEDKNVPFWESFVHSMDLHLLADAKYMNMALGLSLSFTGDVAYSPIIPSIMGRQGFSTSEIALMLSVYFGADLVARITLSVVSAFFAINSKMLVLISSGLTALLRIALIFNNTLNYTLIVLGAMGYIRCFIQTPQTLVVSDNYPNNFEAAYSMYMVVNGMVCLVFGLLMSYIKTATGSDTWTCHLLTLAFIAIVVSWLVEMLMCRRKRPEGGNKTLDAK